MRKNISLILIVLIAISYLAIGVRTAEAGVIVPDSCDDLSYWTQRLCIKYCVKLDCDSEIPHDQILRRWLCKYYEFKFLIKTGIEPPCDPCAELAKVAECPCDYNSVPKKAKCWGGCAECTIGDVVFTPCNNPGCEPDLGSGGVGSDTCSLVNDPINKGLFTAQTETLTLCQIFLEDSSCAEDILLDQISQDQFSTCLCRHAQYANELAWVGIQVTDTATPFSCEPSE